MHPGGCIFYCCFQAAPQPTDLSFRIFGVMKIRSSVWESMTDLLLKNHPSTGMSFRKGMPFSWLFLSVMTIPPMTVVSPSLTRTSVMDSFLFMEGLPSLVVKVPIEFLDAFIFIITLPSGVMCGVTVRLRLASTKVVEVPAAEVVSKGID